MAKEWIDVLDTAVKIGLGALISGSFAYFGNRFSHKAQQKKFMHEHKIKVIEEISQQLDVYFSAASGYVNLYAGMVKKLEPDTEEVTLEKNQIRALKNKDGLLVESWVEKNAAKSRLRLLKATEVSGALSDFSAIEYDFRENIVFNRNYPNYNEIGVYRARFLKAKNNVLGALAEEYEKMSL